MKALAFFFALMPIVFGAEEAITLPELKIGDKTYVAVALSLVAPNEAKILHQDGSRSINPVLLSPELRARIGYDVLAAAKATNFQAKVVEEQAKKKRTEEMVATSDTVKIKISTVLPNGILGAAVVYSCAGKRIRAGDLFIETTTEGAEYIDGSNYRFDAVPNGTFRFTTVLGATRTVPKYYDVHLANQP